MGLCLHTCSCVYLYSTRTVTRIFNSEYFKILKGIFFFMVDNWLLAIWAMLKIWVVIKNHQIKNLAQATIWRPKHMTWEDQIKLTYGALVVLCTSCSIWKNCLIFAIPTNFVILFVIFELKQNLKLEKSSLCISEFSKSIF